MLHDLIIIIKGKINKKQIKIPKAHKIEKQKNYILLISFLFLGGVMGLLFPNPLLLVIGFKILKEQTKPSSIIIIAPALSNSPQ